MRQLTNMMDKTLATLGAVSLILMMLHVVANAILRQYFRSPVYGTNELVEYWYLPVIALLGIIAAFIRGEHISVALLYDRMKPGNQREFKILADILGVLVSAGFAWFGLLEAIRMMGFGATAGVTTIPIWPVSFLVPIVFTLLAVLYLLSFVAEIRGNGEDVSRDIGNPEVAALESALVEPPGLHHVESHPLRQKVETRPS